MGMLYLLDVQAKPGTGDEVAKYFQGSLEPGTVDGLDAAIYRGVDDPDAVIVVEQWASAEHHDRFAATKQDAVQTLMTRVTQPPVLRRFQLCD